MICMFKHVSMFFFWSFNAPHVADFPEANTFGRWLADEGRHSGQRLSFSVRFVIGIYRNKGK